MLRSIVYLLQFAVKASESDDAFLSDVTDILLHPTSDEPTTEAKPVDIDPTLIYGAEHLELPSFTYDESKGYICTYSFTQGPSPYRLRPGRHSIFQPMSGTLRIETHEECTPNIWKMNQKLEAFGTVTRESGNVCIEWPAGADLILDFPVLRRNAEPCHYNFRSGRTQIYRHSEAICPSLLRITPDGTQHQVQNLPVLQHSARLSKKTTCVYTYIQHNILPHWLRAGNYRTQKQRKNQVMFRIQTRKECEPRVYKYDTRWKSFGHVKARQSNTPGVVQRQDMTYLVRWVAKSAATVGLHLPAVVNEQQCRFELEGVLVVVTRRQGEPCDHTFTF